MATNSTEQNNEWFEAQKNWTDFLKNWQTPVSPEAYQQQWMNLLKEWQNITFQDQNTPYATAFQEHFSKSGEQFMAMMQDFYQGVGQAKTVEQMTKDWIEKMHDFFSGSINGEDNAACSMDPMGFFASMPGIGYTREKQEQLNGLYKLWIDYTKKSRLYDSHMANVGMEALQAFQEYVANPPKDAAPLESLREVYGKWVDICEDIYAEYAMGEEYTKLYGDTVNALMAFKIEMNKLTDDIMDQFNLPTRKEVDSLHERLHQLRRDNIQLKKELGEIKSALGLKLAKPATVVKESSPAKPAPKAKATTAKKAPVKKAVKKTAKSAPKKTTSKKPASKKAAKKSVKKGKK